MRTELPLTSGVPAFGARRRPAFRRGRGDVIAVVLLTLLPLLVFAVPALLGHAALPADALNQNLPLRVLAGREIRAGHLPLYNPYLWSGAPLLAGWNAGAAYPFTWLFAIVPSTAAWTANLIITWAVAGLGMYWFLRALRLASLASLLGALSFAYAGAFWAQVSHFGLVAGMSWMPVQLLGVLRLCQARPVGSRLGWTAVLATSTGLVILSGEPRAVDDAYVIVVIYAVWQIARLGRHAGPAAISVTAGLVLGVCLGAVQWLPGLAAISTSQRGAGSVALFSSGSLPVKWLLLALVPDLLGGPGSLNQPVFFANYNLTEVTSYVGILPLVAAFALLGRFRWRPRPPEWAVWYIVALAGIVLALGANTPLGSLLYHVPLFGDQRLQSRNVLVLDLALAVLFGYWADTPFASQGRARVSAVLGAWPGVATVLVVALGFTWGAGFLHWLGAGLGQSASVIGRLKPWLAPYAVTGAGATALVIAGPRLSPNLRTRLLCGFVAVDLVLFTVLGAVEVLPRGPGTAAAPGGAGGAGTAGAAGGAGHSAAKATAGTTAMAAAAAPRPVGALGYTGRFAIYDPDLLDPGELAAIGPPDGNAISADAMPSVQGYTSIVDGRYAAATGAHQSTGEGQVVLAPSAVANGTLDQLDTSVLLTPSAYLVTEAGGGGPAAGPPGTGRRDIAADQRTTWYLGTPLDVSTVEVPDPDARQDAVAHTQIGLTMPGGSTRWFRARAMTASVLAITLPRPLASIALIGQAHGAPCQLGSPSIIAADGSVFVADGQLQDALVPPHWDFAGLDGSFAVFANRSARPPLSLQALAGRPASGAWVREVSGAPAEPAAATVFSPDGVRVVRSVAAIPGWSARWQPRHGPATTLTVRTDGLVQAVDVPAGLGVITWSYTSPGLVAGLACSLVAAALTLLLFLAVLAGRARGAGRDRRQQEPSAP